MSEHEHDKPKTHITFSGMKYTVANVKIDAADCPFGNIQPANTDDLIEMPDPLRIFPRICDN